MKASAQPRLDVEHTKWIETALRSMETVKAGTTRTKLLKIFTEEGGLSNPSQRTYVYHHCPYIKVDVKFAPSSNQNELPHRQGGRNLTSLSLLVDNGLRRRWTIVFLFGMTSA
jgi:hypothetical protein